MNLKRIFILTSSITASASEATIIGLEAYDGIEVIQIGETTHGKFCGGFSWTPEDLYSKTKKASEYADIKDWEFETLITFKYANAKGKTDFKKGLTPLSQNQVTDFVPFKPLGSEDDYLMARALEIITNRPAVRSTATKGTETTIQKVNVPNKYWGGMLIDKEDFPLYK